MPALSIGRRGPGAAVGSDGRLYAIGGYSSHANMPAAGRSTVEAYDPAARRWQHVAPIATTNDVYAAAACDGRIYTLGQTPNLYTRGSMSTPFGLHAYDPLTDRWTQCAPPGRAYRCRPTLAAGHDGHIYAGGALQSDGVVVDVYDPDDDSWQPISPPPPQLGAGFASAVGRDGRLHLIGGDLTAAAAYDPQTDRWHAFPPLPRARTNPAITADSEGHIYAIGGFARDIVVRDMHVYTP
jgi:N-acetylneuraminic acid mutarotase